MASAVLLAMTPAGVTLPSSSLLAYGSSSSCVGKSRRATRARLVTSAISKSDSAHHRSSRVASSEGKPGMTTPDSGDSSTGRTERGLGPIRAVLSANESAVRKLLFSAACAAAVALPTFATAAPGFAGPRFDTEVSPPCANVEAYYARSEGLSGPALREALHDIVSGHKVYSYPQAWEALKVLDAADEEDPLKSENVIEIYTRKPVLKTLVAKGDGWNREHLWPRSYGLAQGEPEFSDLHNLRPADINVNSARGNKWFGECSSLQGAAERCLRPANREAAPDTAATSSSWTPPSEVRGDIARALLYMDLRYDGNGDGSSKDLRLSDSPSIASLPLQPPASPSLQAVALPPVTPPTVATAPPVTPASPTVPATPATPATPSTPTTSATSAATAPAAGASVAAPPGAATEGVTPGSVTAPLNPPKLPGPSASAPEALASAPRVEFVGPLPAWLNELHYDNIGVDENEFLEIVARSGVNPDDITIALYNGNDGKIYGSYKLSKFNQGSKIPGLTIFSLVLPSNGLQNGPADGVALIQKSGNGEKVIQFLSYEGELVAYEGPAQGFKSTDIGVAQTDKTPKGSSLGLSGRGKDYKDFKWGVLGKANPGSLNVGQSVAS